MAKEPPRTADEAWALWQRMNRAVGRKLQRETARRARKAYTKKRKRGNHVQHGLCLFPLK